MRSPVLWMTAILVAGALVLAVLCRPPAKRYNFDEEDLRAVQNVLHFEYDGPVGDPDFAERLVDAAQQRIRHDGRVRRGEGSRIEVDVLATEPGAVDAVARVLERPGTLEFRIAASRHDTEMPRSRLEWIPLRNPQDFSTHDAIVSEDGAALLTIIDSEQARVSGKFLTRVHETVDEAGGAALAFQFDREGARRFQALTGANLPRADGSTRKLAIIVDGEVLSAPGIMEAIGADGRITGLFEREEVAEMVAALTTGELPARLRRVDP
jgi:preprotein translocase subunit SecD